MAARSKSKASKKRASSPARARIHSAAEAPDAVALLKADHRQVEKWFGEFANARGNERKRELAHRICKALEVHTLIEEEIFYPAFLAATKDKDTHHEALLEHGSAKLVIADIEAFDPGDDDFYDSRLKVLSELIKHHVKEEEQPGGMFAKARAADIDLKALGQTMQIRKEELMGEETTLRPIRRFVEVSIGAEAVFEPGASGQAGRPADRG